MTPKASALPTTIGLAAAWIAFTLVVWIYGESPRAMASLLFEGTWGTGYGAGQVLFKATPLLFSGIAVELALRAGLFNIGTEGQIAVASLAAAVIGARLAAGAPWFVALPLVVTVAMTAGGAWATVPAILRARYGVHEVISTIMMNRIADAFTTLSLGFGLAVAGTVRTPDVAPGARLPRLEALGRYTSLFDTFRGSAASVATIIAIAFSSVAIGWLARSRVGKEITLVGMNASACAAEGIPVARRQLQALVFSGAIAGLACTGTVLGYKGYYEQGLGAGAGFGGVAVALLGRGRAGGLVMAALLFGTLQQGGLAINAHVPMEVMDVLQGVVIAVVALADARVRAAIAGVVKRGVVPPRGAQGEAA